MAFGDSNHVSITEESVFLRRRFSYTGKDSSFPWSASRMPRGSTFQQKMAIFFFSNEKMLDKPEMIVYIKTRLKSV